MMTFAMQNNMMWEMQMMKNTDCWGKYEKNNWCNKSCCISWKLNFQKNIFNNNHTEKILKIKQISFINFFVKSSNFLENKKLVKNTSPPNIENKIKYYSYSDLVKIIKSNT